MKLTTLALALIAGIGSGCATDPFANPVATSDLPDCFAANYDAQRDLFTMRNPHQDAVNQQCALHVGPRGGAVRAARLAAGSYSVLLANGGGGGAGGTPQGGDARGGGAGGGGAGAMEMQATVNLSEGLYKLTIGAGGPGGNACVFAPYYMGGGPGWIGSPSSIVQVSTGALVVGTAGADSYARPSRAQNEKSAGRLDGHGGSGPGQTTGGHGGDAVSVTGTTILAEAGQGRHSAATGAVRMGGIPGGNEDRLTAGGGGGATSRADGGGGGGESPGHANRAPGHGSLGSGGGGGEGSRFECDPGARGGHGFIALRPI